MAESFDAYHRWLGIPPKDQPPNHYRLLTLEPFESDPDVIEAAADRQMGHLRTYQTGPHSDLSQKLLNEVAAAKVCLLKPEKKAEYDARLRRDLAASSRSPTSPGEVGIDPEVAGAIRQADRGAGAGLPPGMPGRARPNLGVLVGILTAVGAALLLVIAITLWPKDFQRPPAEESVAASNLPGPPAAAPTRSEGPKQTNSPAAQPNPAKPKPPDRKKPVSNLDGQPTAPPAELLPGPKGLANTHEPRPVEPLEGPTAWAVGPVMKLVKTSENLLSPRGFTPVSGPFQQEGDTLVCDSKDGKVRCVASQVVTLDQKTPEPVFARAYSKAEGVAGKTDREYSLHLDVHYTDGTAIFSQKAWFNTGTHDWELGEVYVMPEKPIRVVGVHFVFGTHAGKAWFKGAELYSVKAPEGGARVAVNGPVPVELVDAEAGNATGRKPTVGKVAVPSEAEQQKARKLVLEVFQKQYDRATTPEEQAALARKLLDKVQQEETDPPGRFVLLIMARELAERARHWGTAVEAIDELNAGFRIDAVEMKTQVLEGFAKLARTSPEHAAIAEAALPLVDEAAAQANVVLAGRLAKLAQAEAGKARNRELQVAARASAKQVQELAKVTKEVEAAREALKLNPQDPAANLVLGKYLCFVRGDWTGGLPCLAASSDESLKALAQKDLARPDSPAEMVALGNQWWDLSEKDQPAGQKPCRLRAAHWYRASLDELAPGLERDMVQKRVQEAAGLEEASAPGRDAKKGPFRAYEGTWIVGFTTGKGRRYVIDAGGGVSWGPFRGRLTRRNDDLVIEFSGGTVDRIKLVGDQLQVEHFDSAAAYPAQPTWQGKARRLKKDPEETAARLLRPLQGLWLIQYSNKAARAFAIDAKGNVLAQDLDAKGNPLPRSNKQGQLTVREGEVLLDLQNGTLERLERYGRGLWVEQFHPPTQYPHNIWLFGLGVRK